MANIHMFVLSYYYNILTTTVMIIRYNIYYYLSWKYVNKNALSHMRVCQYLTVVVTIARSTIRSKNKRKEYSKGIALLEKCRIYFWNNVDFILMCILLYLCGWFSMMEMIINPAFYVKQIIKYYIASSKNCFFIVDYGNVKIVKTHHVLYIDKIMINNILFNYN
jgi:hypothetical protein